MGDDTTYRVFSIPRTFLDRSAFDTVDLKCQNVYGDANAWDMRKIQTPSYSYYETSAAATPFDCTHYVS